MRRAGIVLCGGRSLRMGRPKALLPWFGRTLVEHVVARLASCVDEVLVVSARDLPLAELVAGLGAREVFDREAGRGPLAALRDGLEAARAERAFVTTVDAPCVSAAAVDALFARAEAGAVVPRADGHLQVLSAVYPGLAWRDAEALLAAGPAGAAGAKERKIGVGDPRREASPIRLLERIGFVALEAEPSDLLPAWTSFNTPDDYLGLARRIDPTAQAEVEWVAPSSSPSASHSASRSPLPAPERFVRSVPIGSLGEVLRAVAGSGFPTGVPLRFPLGVPPDDEDAFAGFAITFGEGAHAHHLDGLRSADLALPVGPGERVRISPRRSDRERDRGRGSSSSSDRDPRADPGP